MLLTASSVLFPLEAARAQTDAQSLFREGNTLFDEQRWEEALERYDRALALDPELHRAHWYRGACLLELSRLDEALEAASVYRRAARFDAEIDDAEALLTRIRTAIDEREPPGRRLRRSLARRDGPALLTSGAVNLGLGGVLWGVGAHQARKSPPGSPERDRASVLFGAGLGLALSGTVLGGTGVVLTVELGRDAAGIRVDGRLP